MPLQTPNDVSPETGEFTTAVAWTAKHNQQARKRPSLRLNLAAPRLNDSASSSSTTTSSVQTSSGATVTTNTRTIATETIAVEVKTSRDTASSASSSSSSSSANNSSSAQTDLNQGSAKSISRTLSVTELKLNQRLELIQNISDLKAKYEVLNAAMAAVIQNPNFSTLESQLTVWQTELKTLQDEKNDLLTKIHKFNGSRTASSQAFSGSTFYSVEPISWRSLQIANQSCVLKNTQLVELNTKHNSEVATRLTSNDAEDHKCSCTIS